MSEHIVKILEANFITHDVKRFLIEKPKGYTFMPGQGTDVSINQEEWKDKMRPFTFTGLNKWEHLELMVKIYPKSNGVTKQMGRLNAGDEIILHDVFGAIQYKGPGVFIAAGSGITPFLAILRELARNKQIGSNKLIYSNKTSEDIIAGAELSDMLKDNFINVLTRENVVGFLDKHITRDFIIEHIQDFSRPFYICGPDKFVSDMVKILVDLGAKMEALVIEH
ncbi:MAG: flavodoxin reductase [Bacteroidetes bacterium]|nr:flavodoxin reductase [Bacteroidota bacterium]